MKCTARLKNVSNMQHTNKLCKLITLGRVSGVQNPNGIVIDWLSGNMYFGSHSNGHGAISVSKLDGAYRTNLEISSNFLVKPHSIAIHPVEGLVSLVCLIL